MLTYSGETRASNQPTDKRAINPILKQERECRRGRFWAIIPPPFAESYRNWFDVCQPSKCPSQLAFILLVCHDGGGSKQVPVVENKRPSLLCTRATPMPPKTSTGVLKINAHPYSVHHGYPPCPLISRLIGKLRKRSGHRCKINAHF